MKILQICHRVPYPPVDGGNIVMMNMAVALTEAGHEVYQFALNTLKHFVQPDTIPSELRNKLHFQSVTIDTKIRISGAIKNLFTSGSYNVDRFYHVEAENALAKVLRENHFDIVQLETLFPAPYIKCIREHSTAKIVLRAHNVEHIIWERLAAKEDQPLKKKYIRFLAARLKKYELQVMKEVDAIVPITPVDESVFLKYGCNKPMLSLPMSLNLKDYNFDENLETEMCLFHLGSMDWMPNREAVEWFLGFCWMPIHKMFPDLKLYLAGRSFPEEIKNRNFPNVICEGRIEDAHSYMREKQIMIVPLHSGSGMRVKIIQGLALGRTIISTTIGAEGIAVEDEKNILIADTAQHFVAVVKRCMENPHWCRNIGKKGRKFVEDHYSNETIAHQLTLFYNGILKLKG